MDRRAAGYDGGVVIARAGVLVAAAVLGLGGTARAQQPPGEPATYRPLSLSLDGGLGVLGTNAGAPGLPPVDWHAHAGWAFGVRGGVGITRSLSLTLGLAAVSAAAGGDGAPGETYHHTAVTLGPQLYLTPRVYVRGALGYGSESHVLFGADALPPSADAAAGVELLQRWFGALGLEGETTWVYYGNRHWVTTGLNLVASATPLPRTPIPTDRVNWRPYAAALAVVLAAGGFAYWAAVRARGSGD